MTVPSSRVRSEHQLKLIGQFKTKECFLHTHMLSNGTPFQRSLRVLKVDIDSKLKQTSSWKGNPLKAIKQKHANS